MSAALEVWVNGQSHRLERQATVADLLSQLGLTSDRVAVELDRRIVRRPDWTSTRVSDGARLEIVHFVGGG